MFTTGFKEVVLNSLDGVTATATLLKIEGYSAITAADVVKISGTRAQPAVNFQKDFTVVAPAGIAAGDSVELRATFVTDRYQSEMTSNYIDQGRPIILTTPPLATVTAAAIRTALVAAWTAYTGNLTVEDPILEFTAGTQNNVDLRVTGKHASVRVTKVEIRRTKPGTASTPFVELALASAGGTVVLTDNSEGLNLGKHLEESVRMSTFANVNPYGVQVNGNSQSIDLRGSYTCLVIETPAPNAGFEPHRYIKHDGVNEGSNPQPVRFVIYINENLKSGLVGAPVILDEWLEAAAAAASANAANFLTAANVAMTAVGAPTDAEFATWLTA
jgi:hypothetical protein